MGYWENILSNQPGGILQGSRYSSKTACEAAQAATGSIVYPDQCQYREDAPEPYMPPPPPTEWCPSRTPYYEKQAERGLCVLPPIIPDEPGVPDEPDVPTMCSMFGIDCPIVEPPVQPPPTEWCPRGERFLASGWELILGCPEGYTRPQFGDYCVCGESPEGKGTGEYEEDGGLQSIMKMLPQLLIVMVIVSIIGAFKK